MPGYMVFDQELEGRFIYLSTKPLNYLDQTLIGAWGNDGSILSDENDNPTPIDPFFTVMRPLGNEDGVATDSLDYHHWMGHKQRHQQPVPLPEILPQYPVGTQPIILTMERYWDTTPGWEGWGWKATIEFSDPDRAPDARAVGIYDADWNYLYTTGAFVWTDVGGGIFKWQTHNPAGRAAPEKEPLYYALLLGSAQEGRMELLAGADSRVNFFWDEDQNPGYVPPSEGQWEDSGETTQGMAGQVVLTSSIDPLEVGMKVRIAGVESVITDLWVGAGQGFLADPYQAYAADLVIEIWV